MGACSFDAQGHRESPNVLISVGRQARGKRGEVKCLSINKACLRTFAPTVHTTYHSSGIDVTSLGRLSIVWSSLDYKAVVITRRNGELID